MSYMCECRYFHKSRILDKEWERLYKKITNRSIQVIIEKICPNKKSELKTNKVIARSKNLLLLEEKPKVRK